MKKSSSLFIVIFIAFNIFSTNLHASTVKGKKFYTQHLKSPCGFGGDVMGKKHTTNEWKTLYQNNRLSHAIQMLCPKAPAITSPKDLANLYDFFSAFASDSGNVPACN